MKPFKKISAVLLTFALIGCGCSSSSDPAPVDSSTDVASEGASAADATTQGATTDTGTPDTANDAGTGTPNPAGDAGTNPITASGTGGLEPGDPNPGSIPDPILSELTTINIVDFGGFKIYAGPEDVGTSRLAYINLDFKCDGTGTFEAYPNNVVNFLIVTKGNLTWEVRDDLRQIEITIVDRIEGNELSLADIDINDLESSTKNMIVGETRINKLLVSRIVGYEQCPSE